MISERHFNNWLISSFTVLGVITVEILTGMMYSAIASIAMIVVYPLVTYALYFLLEKWQGRKRR